MLGPTLRSFNTCIHHQCLHVHLKMQLSLDSKSIFFLERTQQNKNVVTKFQLDNVIAIHVSRLLNFPVPLM